ncbi:MAG: cation:proton antiporter [Collinsella sp.]
MCLTIKPVGKNSPSPPCSSLSRSACCWASTAGAYDFSDYALTETVCSTALLFIMFYGGFNTNIDRAKPVAVPAVLLSTLGVVITAGITGVFAHFVLGFDWIGGPAGIGRGIHRRGQRL